MKSTRSQRRVTIVINQSLEAYVKTALGLMRAANECIDMSMSDAYRMLIVESLTARGIIAPLSVAGQSSKAPPSVVQSAVIAPAIGAPHRQPRLGDPVTTSRKESDEIVEPDDHVVQDALRKERALIRKGY